MLLTFKGPRKWAKTSNSKSE